MWCLGVIEIRVMANVVKCIIAMVVVVVIGRIGVGVGIGHENVIGVVVVGWLVSAVIDGFVGNGVGIIFVNERCGINRWHIFFNGTCFNQGYGIIRNRENSPGAAVNFSAGEKRHKEIVAA